MEGLLPGKTTFLNGLADYIPEGERIIVIEDSSELKLRNIKNIVHLECRNSNVLGQGQVDMSQLIKSSLRMRPDRIIVGEVRGKEVLDMIQAMNTGHSGSMSTGHGNSVRGMLRRLESMFLMAVSLDVDAVRGQIAEAIDIMVHLEKRGDGKRYVVEICEVYGYEEGEFRLNDLMVMDGDKELKRVGNLISDRRIILGGKKYEDRLRKSGFIL